jgi:hypothetical protein
VIFSFVVHGLSLRRAPHTGRLHVRDRVAGDRTVVPTVGLSLMSKRRLPPTLLGGGAGTARGDQAAHPRRRCGASRRPSRAAGCSEPIPRERSCGSDIGRTHIKLGLKRRHTSKVCRGTKRCRTANPSSAMGFSPPRAQNWVRCVRCFAGAHGSNLGRCRRDRANGRRR